MTAFERTNRLPGARLRAPSDVEVANRAFGANCGPAAFAAVLSLQVCDVMQYFTHFEMRRFTTTRDMLQALAACSIEFAVETDVPDFGLLLLQIDGPWTTRRGANRWSRKYSHWIATCSQHVYDINVGCWMPLSDWQESIMPALVDATRHATGWSVARSVRVLEQSFSPEEAVPGLCFG